MKKVIILLAVTLFFSCNTNDVKNKKVTEIQIDTLDKFPVYYECKNIIGVQKQMDCLNNNLSFFYAYHLTKTFYDKIKNRQDTVKMHLELDTLGYLQLNSCSHSNRQNIQKVDSVLQAITKMVPKMEPALARGKKVFFKFNLPVILKN